MSWRRRTLVLLVTAVVWVAALGGAPAAADHESGHGCGGEANVDRGGTGEASGECGGETTPTPVGDAPECDASSDAVAYFDDPPPEWVERRPWNRIAGDPPEGMRYAAAYNCAGMYLGGPYLVADPAWRVVEAARDAAAARVAPPMPDPHVSPEQAVVRMPTWLWVDEDAWQPASASASQGAVEVRVEARPVEVTWDLVEGIRVCGGPGIAWSQQAHDAYEAQPADVRGRGNPACTFTFRHSSSTTPTGLYEASVTVVWEFSWWLNGEPRGVFGTVERTSGFELRVGEVQALITGYDER